MITKQELMEMKYNGYLPQYTFTNYNKTTQTYEGFIITKTAEQVYQESQQIDNLTQIKTNEDLTKENEQLWQTVEFLLKNTGFIPSEEV